MTRNGAAARDVLVVIGVGGMGLAIARRLGSGRSLLVADLCPEKLEAAAGGLEQEGHRVTAHPVDVSEPASVMELARASRALGPVRYVAHTAGISPVQAPVDAVLRVDLVGTALVLEEFGEIVEPGGSGVVIASMAGHFAPPMDAEDESRLACTPASALMSLQCAQPGRFPDSGLAYAFAKRANLGRVRAESVRWGRGGARVNSISPGVISTPMGQSELAGPSGAGMQAMIEASGTGRVGTADDIAAAADFLLGPAASFVTGTDLLVDGGVVAAVLSAKGEDHGTG